VITVLLVLALARSRRGQQCIEAIRPLIAMAWEALLPIFVELANLGRSIRHLPHRWRDRHDRHPAR
jgi:hypothetical protein